MFVFECMHVCMYVCVRVWAFLMAVHASHYKRLSAHVHVRYHQARVRAWATTSIHIIANYNRNYGNMVVCLQERVRAWATTSTRIIANYNRNCGNMVVCLQERVRVWATTTTA